MLSCSTCPPAYLPARLPHPPRAGNGVCFPVCLPACLPRLPALPARLRIAGDDDGDGDGNEHDDGDDGDADGDDDDDDE